MDQWLDQKLTKTQTKNMNPIEKLTDPSFTESAKGLMTLFCIGVIHLIIGVELTETKIAIPWLPTVNFEHPERLTYLFWGLVFYSTYRYTLHHAEELRKLRFESLYSGLSKPLGRAFIESNINEYCKDVYYDIKTESDNKTRRISMKWYTHHGLEHDQRVHKIFTFDIIYSSDYRFTQIEASENPDFPSSKVCFNNDKQKKKWDLQPFSEDEFGEFVVYKSFGIPLQGYKASLFFVSLSSFCMALCSKKQIFDLMLPLILNAILAVAYLV